jgi:hypothetical protein
VRRFAFPIAYSVGVVVAALATYSVGRYWGSAVFGLGVGVGLVLLYRSVRPRVASWPGRRSLGVLIPILLLAGFFLLGGLGAALIAAGVMEEPDRDPIAEESSAPTPSSEATPSPSTEPSAEPSDDPTSTPRPTATPVPLPPTSATLADAPMDTKSDEGAPVDGPGYIDIIEVSVSHAGDDWLFTIRTRSNLQWRDLFSESLWYGFHLDVDGDGLPDYQVSLENGGDPGEWSGVLFDWEDGYTYDEDEFPGAATPAANTAQIRLVADSIGNPGTLWTAGEIERGYWPDPVNEPLTIEYSGDGAPDVQFPDDDPDWIVVRR